MCDVGELVLDLQTHSTKGSPGASNIKIAEKWRRRPLLPEGAAREPKDHLGRGGKGTQETPCAGSQQP